MPENNLPPADPLRELLKRVEVADSIRRRQMASLYRRYQDLSGDEKSVGSNATSRRLLPQEV